MWCKNPMLPTTEESTKTGDGNFRAYIQSRWYFRPSLLRVGVHRTSIPLSPSASKLGSQPCWVACLLVCVSVVGYAKNSAAEKIIILSAYFCLETKFQQYFTRTVPDDDNFCLFLFCLPWISTISMAVAFSMMLVRTVQLFSVQKHY